MKTIGTIQGNNQGFPQVIANPIALRLKRLLGRRRSQSRNGWAPCWAPSVPGNDPDIRPGNCFYSKLDGKPAGPPIPQSSL